MRFMRHISVILLLGTGYIGSLFAAGDTLWVPVIYYDFRASGSNPNFNMDNNTNQVVTGMIKSSLSSDYKPLFKENKCDNDRVEEWYRPSGAGSEAVFDVKANWWSGLVNYNNNPNEWVSKNFNASYDLANIVFFDSLPLIKVIGGGFPEGTYQYTNRDFFPLDNNGFGNEGHQHNYSFSMELHSEFTYTGDEFLEFTGDDDVWVFINGKLALDLGGIHEPQSGSFRTKDIESSHDLELGRTYRFDLFFAERHVVQSNLLLTTNIVSPVMFKAAEYHETDVRPDGLIDLIRVRVDNSITVTDEMIDKLYESLELPGHRDFTYDRDDFTIITGGFEIVVEQPEDTEPFTAVDKKDVLDLTENIEINGQLVLTKQEIKITDKLGAVINKAIFSFGSYPPDYVEGKDTLEVFFSEKILIPISDEPFQFCYKGNNQQTYSMKLDLDLLSGGDGSDVMKFRVISKEKQTPESGDSIWIREGGSVIDMANVPQALNTVGRPLVVKNKINFIPHVIGPYVIGTPIDPNIINDFDINQTEGVVILVELLGIVTESDLWSARCNVFDAVGNRLGKDITGAFRQITTNDGKVKTYFVFVWDCKNRNGRDVGPGAYCGLITVYWDKKKYKAEKVFIGVKY